MDDSTNNILYAVWLEKEVNRILEQDASTRPWAAVDKSKLPKQCFLWVEDPEKKATWHLPYREGVGGIDPDTGMYAQAGPVNLAALRAVSAAIAGARTGKPMSVPPQIRSKIKKLLKKYKIGEFAESLKTGRKEIVETYATNQFTQANLDKENCVISGVAIMRPTSSNKIFPESKGRKYSGKALETVAGLLAGKKSYADHATDAELQASDGVRKIRDMIGYFENGRVDGEGIVRGDLHYLKNHKDWIEPMIEQMADKIGNSIHAFASDIVYDGNSKMEIVEDITELASVDLVTEPGSTVNLFESKKETNEEDEMDYELITVSELKENRPDIFDSIKESLSTAMDKTKELDEFKTKIASLETENKNLKEANDKFRVKEKAREKEQKIHALIEESKIKKEFVTEVFLGDLRNAPDEAAMKATIEDRKKLVEGAVDGVKGMGDDSNPELKETEHKDFDKKMDRAVGYARKKNE